MTEEEINLLYVLKRKLDAGELTQKEFDDAVAIIRGTKNNTNDSSTLESSQKTAPSKKEEQGKKKGVIIAAIVATVVLLALGLFFLLSSNNKKDSSEQLNNHVDSEETLPSIQNPTSTHLGHGKLDITEKKIKNSYLFKASQTPDVHYGEFTVDISWPICSGNVDISKLQKGLLLGSSSVEKLIAREIQEIFPSDKWESVKEKSEAESDEVMTGDYMPYAPSGSIKIYKSWADKAVGLYSFAISATRDVGTGTQFGIDYSHYEVIYDIYNDMIVDYNTIFRHESYRNIMQLLKTNPVYYYDYCCVNLEDVNRVPTTFEIKDGVCYFAFEREEISIVADGDVMLGIPIRRLLPYMTPYGQSVFSKYEQ